MATQAQKLYSITIFGYKKEGMDEKEYHDYISKSHAGHLKALLAKNDIVSYTMVSNRASQASLYVHELEADPFRHKSNTTPRRRSLCST
jgi:hypothetical protein